MRIEEQICGTKTQYLLYKEQTLIGSAVLENGHIPAFSIDPCWRGKGYGCYLLKELLRRNGGFDPQTESCFTAPLPDPSDAAAMALAKRFGFAESGGVLRRLRVPDLTAVRLVHRMLTDVLAPGGLYLDATCGNGHDTLFLCGLAGPKGRVIGLDIQPAAVQATNALLAQKGMEQIGRAVQADHSDLARFAPPGSADCVMFNFGWLPGAPHEVHSQADNSLRALQAGLDALKPGGVLSAVLYSGKVIGDSEKRAALDFFRSLPLTRYTVLVCQFANWAEEAPLPCLIIKRPGGH